MSFLKRISLGCGVLLLLFGLAGCRTAAPPAPGQVLAPPPPPSRALLDRWRYHYYPSAEVYFSPFANLYFYRDDGVWISAAILPPRFRIDLRHYVVVEIDDDRPYRRHPEIRRHYPREKYRRWTRRQWDRERENEAREWRRRGQDGRQRGQWRGETEPPEIRK